MGTLKPLALVNLYYTQLPYNFSPYFVFAFWFCKLPDREYGA